MKLLNRNLQTVYYCTFIETSEGVDENGYETGEMTVGYSEPHKLKCSISPAKGEAQIGMFGSLDSYDKVLITDDMNCPIDEHSILYIENNPETDDYDYVVTRVAKSLNFISYAISKVKVSTNNNA